VSLPLLSVFYLIAQPEVVVSATNSVSAAAVMFEVFWRLYWFFQFVLSTTSCFAAAG